MGKKVERVARMIADGVDPEQDEYAPYSLSIRLPGDLANRFFALYDLSSEGISRNAMVCALVEAGLEAVEEANRSKGAR